MEGKEGDLDAEANQQCPHQQQLRGDRQRTRHDRVEAEVNPARQQCQTKEGTEDEHPRHRSDNQKLGGGVSPICSSPDGNQHPQGDQFQFIEEEEEQKVLRQKSAIHSSADHQQECEVNPGAILNAPRCQSSNQAQHSIHQQQRHGKAVHR